MCANRETVLHRAPEKDLQSKDFSGKGVATKQHCRLQKANGSKAKFATTRSSGLPTRLTQLKTRTPITDRMLEEAAYSTNLMPGSYKKLTHGEIYDILMECK